MLALTALLLMNSQNLLVTQVRTETRERIENGRSSIARVEDRALELEVAPVVRYDYIGKRGDDHMVLLYTPRFILPNVGDAISGDFSDRRSRFSPYHNAGFGLELQRPGYKFMLYGFGAYGSITTSALLYQKPWNGEGFPVVPMALLPAERAARFTLIFYQPQVATTFRLAPHWSLTPMVKYNAFGGADGVSRATIPLTAGPQAQLVLEAKPTRRDTFRTLLGVSYTEITAAQLDVTGTFQFDRPAAPVTAAFGEQRYSRDLARDVIGEVAIGANAFSSLTAGARLAPTGEVNIQYRGVSKKIVVRAKQEPWLNIFGQEFEPRTELTAAGYFDLSQHWVYRAQATGARTLGKLDSVSRYTLLLGDTGIQYKITRAASVDGGVRFGFQDLTNANIDSRVTQLILYAGFTYAPPLPTRL
jgi:hypothetical protein